MKRGRSRHGASQPVDDGVDPLPGGDRLVECLPVRRMGAPGIDAVVRPAAAAPCDLAARPEHRCAADTGLFGGDPDRFGGIPPERVVGRHGKGFAGARRVLHPVADDTALVRAHAGGDRPEIGKGLGREAWLHRARHPVRRQPRQIGRDRRGQIVGPRAVDPDQDRDRRTRLRNDRGDRDRRGQGGATAKGQDRGEQGRDTHDRTC